MTQAKADELIVQVHGHLRKAAVAWPFQARDPVGSGKVFLMPSSSIARVIA
jgi:hypothetical protein